MTITVYSANKCMQCRFTKEMLEREGVEFSEKNVDDNETSVSYTHLTLPTTPYV